MAVIPGLILSRTPVVAQNGGSAKETRGKGGQLRTIAHARAPQSDDANVG